MNRTSSQQQDIARARVEQIKRANSGVPTLEDYRAAGEPSEVERLRLLLADARAQIADMQDKLDMLTQARDKNSWTSKRGRRTCTPEEAAAILNVSVSTINRSLDDGTIQGEQKPGKKGRWIVYVDSLRRRKRKPRKQAKQ